MRRLAMVTMALALVMGAFGVPSARANGSASGKTFEISLTGLPDRCPVGVTMHGELGIRVFDDRSVTEPMTVKYRMSVLTPFGNAKAMSGTVKMMPGTAKVIPMDIPVGYRAPSGTYYLELQVTVENETLEVGHTVSVIGR